MQLFGFYDHDDLAGDAFHKADLHVVFARLFDRLFQKDLLFIHFVAEVRQARRDLFGGDAAEHLPVFAAASR